MSKVKVDVIDLIDRHSVVGFQIGVLILCMMVAALDGFTIETCLLLPFTGGMLLLWGLQGTGAFTPAHPGRDLMLILGGPLTALPLILFAAGARRVSLSTLGFLQYLSPSISLAIAVLVLGEAFSPRDAASFGCVWLALALVAADGHLRRRSTNRPIPGGVSDGD